MSQTSEHAPMPLARLGPETLFRIGPVEQGPELTSVSMAVGAWSADEQGLPCAGALGVLVDDALGYAVIARRPEGAWSVSAEISLEVCAPLPAGAGRLLRAEASVIQADADGGLATGRVVDDAGTVLAVCSQRGRFVRGAFGAVPASAWTSDEVWAVDDDTSVALMLGAEIRHDPQGASFRLPVTSALANPLGNLHGGVSLCASELVGLAAINAVAGPRLATASVHVAYSRGIPLGSAVTFRAHVVHRGRSLAVAHVVSSVLPHKPCTIATITAHTGGPH